MQTCGRFPMRIENQKRMDVLQEDEIATGKTTKATEQTSTYVKTSVLFSKAYEQNKTQETTYDKPVDENKITAENIKDEAKGMDATLMRDQMLFSVNTTTASDSKSLKEEGFALHDTDVPTIVTVTDKIKLQLAKAGEDVSYMGDGLSDAKLEEMTGSAVQVSAVKGQMQQAQESEDRSSQEQENVTSNEILPDTKENKEDTKETIDMAAKLKELSDGAMKYMLDNQCLPSVSNLYKAQFSGSATYMSQTNQVSQFDFSQMQSQITNVITGAGLSVNDNTLQNSAWMIENHVDFTSANLRYMDTLQNMTLPPDMDTLNTSMTQAVLEGNRPQDAMLTGGFSMTDQAINAKQVIDSATDSQVNYLVNQNMDITIQNLSTAQRQIQANPYLDIANQSLVIQENTAQTTAQTQSVVPVQDIDSQTASNETMPNQEDKNQSINNSVIEPAQQNQASTDSKFITAKRQLEETRLVMTTQANFSLLKQGISIDTKPLAELVEDLKNVENQSYASLLKACGATASDENVNVFKNTTTTVDELKTMPSYVLGLHATRDITTINSLHQSGLEIQADLKKANQTYETLMTQPRSDLGDSIQKAFQNVDDILDDLDLEQTDANQRAVRILAYNSMDLTTDNITKVKALDEKVQKTFANLSPAVVRELIKTGTNPLDMDLDSLNEKASQITEELDTAGSEKFSEYLWKLEQNNDITTEERSSYIGIYRLMNQVEKTDGAAVGALMEQGSSVTMRNLLTMVRSSNNLGMELTADDSTKEEQDDSVASNLSITDQIEKGYHTDCIKNAFSLASPSRLQSVISKEGAWQDMSPELFLSQLRNTTASETEENAYQSQQVADYEKMSTASEDVYTFLQKYDIQNTASNITAVQQMMSNRNAAYKRLFSKEQQENDDVETLNETSLDEATADRIEAYGEAVKSPKELKEAIDQLQETASGVLSNYLGSETDISSMKVKEMKLMYKQVALAGKMAEKETYSFPVVIQNEITNVNLKIVRGEKEKGLVNITFENSELGKVAAQMSYHSNSVTGYIACDQKQTKDLFTQNIGNMQQTILDGLNTKQTNKDNLSTDASHTTVELQVIENNPLDLNRFLENTKRTQIGEQSSLQTGEENQVQTTTLYKLAESFLNAAKEQSKI